MARPYKNGLEYFPLDVHAFEDPKLESLHYHYGPIAVFVYIRVLALVYENGYYLEKTHDDLLITLQRLIGPHWIRVDKISEMIHACVELRLFEGALFHQGVITSISIQKQYILSTKRRKNVNTDKYWLLDSATMKRLGVLLSMQKNKVIVSNNPVNADNNSINVSRSTQSKSKKKKDKKDKLDKSIYGVPKMHFLTKLLIERKYLEETSGDIIKYNDLFEEVINIYGYEQTLSGVNYLISYSKRASIKIDDYFNFFRTSLMNNMDMLRRRELRKDESFEEWIESRIL